MKLAPRLQPPNPKNVPLFSRLMIVFYFYYYYFLIHTVSLVSVRLLLHSDT